MDWHEKQSHFIKSHPIRGQVNKSPSSRNRRAPYQNSGSATDYIQQAYGC